MITTLWLLAATYILLAGGLLMAAGLAPEGHEDERGFHFGKPSPDETPVRREDAAGWKTGGGEALIAKGDE